MREYIEKVSNLNEAIPYIKMLKGKVIVIKYGGSAMTDEKIKQTIMQDIVFMHYVGIHPVIVHGGGPEINKMLKLIGKEPQFVNGFRVTDQVTMDIAEMVLAGKINKDIVNSIQKQGAKAVGICGKDGKTLIAKKLLPDGCDAGMIGEITNVNIDLVRSLIESDFIPVIAPVSSDEEGNTYNINADLAAVAIAGALNAEKLLFLTNTEGVMRDILDSSSIISELSVNDIPNYIQDGTISGGMIPKVQCCACAVEKGVNTVHILDGRLEHSLLLEIFTHSGIGTMIKAEE